jgi:FAD binding domain/PASTA domain
MAQCGPGAQWVNFGKNINFTPFQTCQPSNLDELVAAVQRAESFGFHAHGFGSKWSFSDCAITSDFMIDTTGLPQGFVDPNKAIQKALLPDLDPDLFAHFYGGTTIANVNSQLDGFRSAKHQAGLGLITMPASSTMTIAGAISTGSHGSDMWLSPLADTIAAIHLVGAGGTQFWIERNNPITDRALISEYVAPGIQQGNIIYDSSIFESVLVSVGVMGIIYSLVINVRDQYGLEESILLSDWQSFKTSPVLFDRTARFLTVIVDPYPDANGLNPCLIQTRIEASISAAESLPKPGSGDVAGAFKHMISDMVSAEWLPGSNAWQASDLAQNLENQGADTLTIAQAVINFVLGKADETLWGILTQDYSGIMTAWSPPGSCGDVAYKVMDQGLRGDPGSNQLGGDSIEITLPGPNDRDGSLPFVEFVEAAINAINAAKNTVLAGWFNLRFTGPTSAALGMQQWDRCCSVELSTLPNIQGLPDLLSSLIDMGYKMGGKPHWGQRNDGLVSRGNATIYPRLPEWRTAYARLSDNRQRLTFENRFSTQWQLTTPSVDVIAVSPTSFSFGRVPLVAPATTSIAITNNSFMGLAITWGLLQPGGVFSVNAPPEGGMVLTPGQSFTVWVTAAPTVAGPVQNTLVISTPDVSYVDNPQVPLSAIGVAEPVVPDVVGDLASDAVSAIQAAGLASNVRYRIDQTCNNINSVMTQSPHGGARATPGEVVTITVGLTPPHGCP